MRRTLALVTLAGCLASPSASALETGAAATGPRVTMFGDSIAGSLDYVPDARALLGEGVDLRLELTPCRRLVSPGCPYQGVRASSALDVVRSSSSSELGNIVIVDVGYNESAVNYDTDMATLANALDARGVEHVIWVTLREQTDDYRRINAIIRAQARRRPQLQVADWEAASRGKDWFNDDGLHLNADGAVGLATLLRPYVLADCGAACQPETSSAPRAAPRNLRPPSVRGVPNVGRTLTCRPGSWAGSTPIVLRYSWVRHGRVVAGAHGRSRRLAPADGGQRVACRVWAGNAVGAARATSRAVPVRRSP